MRLEGGLEGIELGPKVGGGSFGRVFKGRWKGALVAIKVHRRCPPWPLGRLRPRMSAH